MSQELFTSLTVAFSVLEVRTHELPLLIMLFPLLHAFILWICCNGINILFVHLVAYIFNSECIVNILCINHLEAVN